MAGIEIGRIYPSSVKIAHGPAPVNTLAILKSAATELAGIFPRRSQHIESVAKALNAISNRDRNFFLNRMPESLIETEIKQQGINRDVFTGRYIRQLEQIFEQYAALDRADREILELAVWGHDLGVPFGIEWEHNRNGSEVILELIQDKKVQQPVSALVRHHGEYPNLLSSTFPRDIYQLPRDLQKLLLIFDFCDATARIDKQGAEVNPVGLKTLSFYVSLIPETGLARLEDPECLFKLRCDFGFAPIIFNRPGIDQETVDLAFKAIAELNPAHDQRRVVEFFGSQFRCNFMDLLLGALENPAAKANLFAAIYTTYHHGQMTGDVLLWPDLDLGRLLGDDPNIFIKALSDFVSHSSINELFVPLPFRSQLLLQVSKLMNQ